MGHPVEPATRYRADVVVTGSGTTPVERPGVLDVVDGRISWVGPSALAPPWAGRVVDLGGLVMPGLVNSHGHTPMTLLRGVGDGLPLARWLEEAIWPREARLNPEDVYWGMLLGAEELLRAGVTTSCEMYFHNEALVDAALEAGIRCVVTPGIFDLPGTGAAGSWRRFLEGAQALHGVAHGRDERVSVGFGPHSAYALPAEGLTATARAAAEVGALVHIHLAESATEDAQLRAVHGCSVPELLARLGVLQGPVLAAHAIWLDDADVEVLGRHRVAVAHCPQSNAKLGSGVARLGELLARGITVGLGTDGPASNDNLDLWEEMRLAPLLARATARDPGAVSTTQAFHLATRGGADALGLECGSLEPGRLADFARLEMQDATFTPALDDAEVMAHLVWAAPSRLVTDVFVGGRPVVRGGRCTTVDAAEARRQVAGRARRLRG